MERMVEIKRCCVFCGHHAGNLPLYEESVLAFGNFLAVKKIGLVYGGGTVGLMGTLARTVHAAGGEVIGVIPEALTAKEASGEMIGEVHIVQTMHQRKAKMAELADAFVALPGGYGTFEELFEVLTWQQLGIHQKPVGILNVNGYYDHLIQFTSHAIESGFISRDLLVVDTDGQALLKKMEAYTAPEGIVKWLKEDQT